MSASLYSYGQSRPPKTPRRRLLWACAVLLFSAGLLPFAIWGVVEQALAGEVMGTISMSFLSLLLLLGIGASIYAFIDIARGRRVARRGPRSDGTGTGTAD